MAIFNNSDSTNQSSKPDTNNTTIITSGSIIKGDMTLSCNLYVDGEFEGVINSKNEITIGKQGHIKGDIVTQRLIVQGFVEGSINAQRVEIKSQGRVHGTIESAELVIEAKGIFEGNSMVKKSDVTPAAPAKLQSNKL